jgi:hypothetical protein
MDVVIEYIVKWYMLDSVEYVSVSVVRIITIT